MNDTVTLPATPDVSWHPLWCDPSACIPPLDDNDNLTVHTLPIGSLHSRYSHLFSSGSVSNLCSRTIASPGFSSRTATLSLRSTSLTDSCHCSHRLRCASSRQGRTDVAFSKLDWQETILRGAGKDLSHAEMRILMTMSTYADSRSGGSIHPGKKRIADDTGSVALLSTTQSASSLSVDTSG